MTVSLPVNLGGLRLGNIGPHGINVHDTGLHRIQADKGGVLQQPFNVSGAAVYYPRSIGAFSPLSLLGDEQRSIAVVWTTDLELPVNVSMYEMPRGSYTPSIAHVLGTPLACGRRPSRSSSRSAAAAAGRRQLAGGGGAASTSLLAIRRQCARRLEPRATLSPPTR